MRPRKAPQQPILVAAASGQRVEISQLSPLIRALSRQRLAAVNLYVPEECRPAVRQAVRSLVRG